MRAKLTDKYLQSLSANGRFEVWDTLVPDLYVRVSPARKAWMVRYYSSGVRVRESIGTWPTMGVSVARDAARNKLLDLEEAKGADKFGVVCEKFLEVAVPTLAKTTQREWTRLINTEVIPALGDTEHHDLRSEVRVALDRIQARSIWTRNRVFEVVRRIYNWGVARDMIEPAPVFAGMEKLAEPPRERLLSDEEVGRVLLAVEREPVEWRAFWILLFYTGARRGTVLAARWDQIKDDVWLVPSEIIKGRVGELRSTAIPLSKAVVKALDLQRAVTSRFDYVLANPRTGALRDNPQKAAQRVWEEAAVEGAHVHDIRHYVSTTLARLAVVPHVIDAIMMHTSGPRIRRRYQQYEYLAEKREALTRLGERLDHVRESASGPTTPPRS